MYLLVTSNQKKLNISRKKLCKYVPLESNRHILHSNILFVPQRLLKCHLGFRVFPIS